MKWRLYKEKLYWLRCKNGWSQEEAGTACGGVDRKQYHLWESGKTLRPQKRSLELIAKGFGLESWNDIILSPSESIGEIFLSLYKKTDGPIKKEAIKFEQTTDKIKLVIFDLDGTLLKGFDFSWRLVWEFIGDNGELRKRGLKLFYTGKINYEEWCVYCGKYFIDYGLSKKDFHLISQTTHVTNNLYKTLDQLKLSGVRTAIISGGIDTLLEIMIPDCYWLFDYIFINRFKYDNRGSLQSITPTPYDLDEKSRGIEYICRDQGISSSNCAFVGAAFAGKSVVNSAGLTIACQPNYVTHKDLSDVVVENDDLAEIVPWILHH